MEASFRSCPAPAPNSIAVAPAYHRHRPEQTALYAIVAEHYPRFVQELERTDDHLPGFVRKEFEDYLKCGLLEHGFLRVKCDGCRHEHLVAFSCKHRGFCPSCGARRMVHLDLPDPALRVNRGLWRQNGRRYPDPTVRLGPQPQSAPAQFS